MAKNQLTIPLHLKLSNNQSKTAEAWYLAIMTAIRESALSFSSDSLEALLKKYQAKDATQLKGALNAQKDNKTALGFACELCRSSLDFEHAPTSLPILKKNVLLLLEYGADTDFSTPHPFKTLFSEIALMTFPANYEFKFTDLVLEMINRGANLTLKHQKEMTIAHLAAALDRKRSILSKILDKHPDLLNEEDSALGKLF